MNGVFWVSALVVLSLAAALALVLGRRRENAKADTILRTLVAYAAVARERSGAARESGGQALPAPVARYFERALPRHGGEIRLARLRNAGTLRMSTQSQRWHPFTARQVVVPGVCGFVWDARVAMPLGSHVRVVDSHVDGIGAGRVSLLSAIPAASGRGRPELNSGALHRYLAEAVWYPTALRPESGVRWEARNESTAIAHLDDRGVSVALEFRFNAQGEVESVYSPGRWCRFGDQYRKVPWEGHFRDYEVRQGFRIPAYGEVGWYVGGQWQPVWKGRLTASDFEISD